MKLQIFMIKKNMMKNRLKLNIKMFFERAILKMYFQREQF